MSRTPSSHRIRSMQFFGLALKSVVDTQMRIQDQGLMRICLPSRITSYQETHLMPELSEAALAQETSFPLSRCTLPIRGVPRDPRPDFPVIALHMAFSAEILSAVADSLQSSIISRANPGRLGHLQKRPGTYPTSALRHLVS